MELLDQDEARQRVREMVDSGEWWVIPWVGERAADLSIAIEERAYSGEANADFIAVLGPWYVTFAHKRRLPAKELGELMVDLCPWAGMSVDEWRETLTTQDVLVALTESEMVAGLAPRSLLAFHEWVMGRLVV